MPVNLFDKLKSRKLAVAIATLVSVLAIPNLTPLQMGLATAVACVYVAAEAIVDRGRESAPTLIQPSALSLQDVEAAVANVLTKGAAGNSPVAAIDAWARIHLPPMVADAVASALDDKGSNGLATEVVEAINRAIVGANGGYTVTTEQPAANVPAPADDEPTGTGGGA